MIVALPTARIQYSNITVMFNFLLSSASINPATKWKKMSPERIVVGILRIKYSIIIQNSRKIALTEIAANKFTIGLLEKLNK